MKLIMSDKLIYKICTEEEWTEAEKTGVYSGSADDERDGFIHFSTSDQVEGTLKKHFVGQVNLLLLSVDVTHLDEQALKWEVSRNGEKFPHLYMALDIHAVVGVKRLPDQEVM